MCLTFSIKYVLGKKAVELCIQLDFFFKFQDVHVVDKISTQKQGYIALFDDFYLDKLKGCQVQIYCKFQYICIIIIEVFDIRTGFCYVFVIPLLILNLCIYEFIFPFIYPPKISNRWSIMKEGLCTTIRSFQLSSSRDQNFPYKSSSLIT